MWNDVTDSLISNINVPFLTKEIIKSFDFRFLSEKTHLVIAAIDRGNKKNNLTRISCRKGLPIPGLAYDSQSDSYLITCISHSEIGTIPISMKMVQKDFPQWKCSIPLPEKTIKRFLSNYQKKLLKNFMSQFESKEVEFKIIQFIDPN
jgi:hypothetical protein